MFKKLFTISLVLVFTSTFIFAQSVNSEIPQKNRTSKFSKGELGEKVKGNDRIAKMQYHPSQEPVTFSKVVGTIDTLSVRKESYALGEAPAYWDNGQSGFGMQGQDNMTIWYQAYADLTIKAVGFACAENTGDNGASVKIVKLSYPVDDLAPSAPEYLGYYPAAGDGYREISAFPDEASGDWVSGGESSNPALYLDGEYDLWSDFGFGYGITPVVTSATEPVYQWIEMTELPDAGEPTVLAGEIFGISIQHEGTDPADDVARMAFWSGDMTINGGYYRNAKHYEDGRNVTGATPPGDGGVWLRSFALDFVAIVDVFGDAAPTISDVTALATTLSTEARNVEATIVDTNPGGGESGVASASLVYTVNDGAEMTVAMASTGGDVYAGDIAGQEAGSQVTYWVTATDVNGNTSNSAKTTYNVFKPNKTNALLVFNGWNGVSGYPVSYYFGVGDFANYSTLEWDHDTWAYGALTADLVNAYDNIIEIATNGPNDLNSAVIQAWLEGAEGRNYMLAGDEWLGAQSGWTNQTYEAGTFHYDILGVVADYNDVNYAAAGDQSLPSMVQAVEGSALGGDLFTLHAQVSADSGWTASIAYDPTYEIDVANWLDGVDFLEDVEVDLTATGIDAATYNIAGHRTLANGNKVVFLTYDPLSLNSHNEAFDGEYWWYGFTSEAPQVRALDWFNAIVVGVEDERTLPEAYDLAQNYPNPFNPATVISYAVPEKADVTLKVFNLLGQEVATLVNEAKTAGTHQVNFNAGNLSSGVYFYTIKAGQFTSTKKMMLLK